MTIVPMVGVEPTIRYAEDGKPPAFATFATSAYIPNPNFTGAVRRTGAAFTGRGFYIGEQKLHTFAIRLFHKIK